MTSKKPIFTVVVPVYNVEKWIEQCIQSILSQTLKDFELLIIDDCGTDNSVTIAEKFVLQDKRVKIIRHEHNKGLGGARNTGVEHSKGKYIVFVDSDDWVEPNQLEVLYEQFESSKADCIIFDAYEYCDATQKRSQNSILNTQNGSLFIDEKNINNFSDYAWVKAYTKKSIVENNITFPEKLTFEDGEFYFKYFSINHNAYCVQKCLYNYRVREGSIVTNKNKGIIKLEDIYQVIKNVREFYIKRGIYNKYKAALLKLVSNRINVCKSIPNNYEKSMILSKQLLEELNFPNEFEDLKENSPFFSVIVPFYNVEKYIEQCLESIQGQTFSDLEIICVDDCGQDNSAKIVEKLAKFDKRIKIVKHKENKGLGAARNTGMKYAKGEYVLFVDSDDWIDTNALQILYDKIKETKLDVISFKVNIWWEDLQKMTDMFLFPRFRDMPEGYIPSEKIDFYTYPGYIWYKVYKRSFLLENNIYSAEGIYFEDIEFHFKMLINLKEFYLIDKVLYYYRRRKDSIIGNSYDNMKIPNDMFVAIERVYKFLTENGLFEKHKKRFLTVINTSINTWRVFPDVQKKLYPRIKEYLKNVEFPDKYL